MNNVVIQSRTFGTELAPLPLRYDVESYSHAAIGGPKLAVIAVSGNELDLWTVVDRLRCPIKIYAETGEAVWWGYVAEIEINVGALAVNISIDSMFNSVAVAYQDGATKARATTTWASDTTSLTEYGLKELLYSISETDIAAAEGARTAMLNQLKYPIPGITQTGLQPGPGIGRLYCRGWWDTLNWQYYVNAGISSIDIAVQAATIMTAEGQFLASVSQDVTAGIPTAETRSGDSFARIEVEELLVMGTSNNRRMLVSIDENRRARLYEEPANTNPYFVERTGKFYDAYGSELRSELCPVANYLVMRDIIPNSANMVRLANPAQIFIEESEYYPLSKQLKIVPRGVPTIYDIGRAANG